MKRGLIILFVCAAAAVLTAGARAAESGEVAMYVFAHQDDEIDVAAKMIADMRAGKSVYCVWVTKGDIGGDPVVREKETRAAMKLIGVPQENLFFLGYPDQGAFRHIGEIVADLVKLVDKLKPDSIMSHAYEGGNIDHDAVAFVSYEAAKLAGVTHYDFPDTNVYKGTTNVWKFLPGGPEVLYTPLDKELFELKIKLIHSYPSQATGLNAYELVLDKKHMKKFGEPYRVAPAYDFSKEPAEEFRYKSTSRNTATIEMFLEAVKKYREEKSAAGK